MSGFWLKNESAALGVIAVAIKELGRSDTPYAIGVVDDQEKVAISRG